ncbi:nucleoid-associated protein [Rhizobium sp. DKSPLA3]|uniref:Nucleoid-associated protein n=1 Tax=Rhizobium quercicola TaxID=2901226 RepID=A0A9X1NW97_9HYPH|nr:nucleoid-associated protein [Rhizobium quercicola]MCD7110466.1 nucleoid-associated protein [Rhizobium quercicola]
MGFFTDDELASLRIENMILHVVSEEGFQPQRSRPVEHAEFFLDRIKDTDASAIFEFDPSSNTKRIVESISTGGHTFESGAQELSQDFARFHGSTSKPGAFFVFELRTAQPEVRFFSFIKYDYQQVIEQSAGENGDLLRLILQAFVAQKKAIQKSAIIRVLEGTALSSLSATDRIMPGLEIADYFAKFLHVKRVRSDEELTRKVRDILRVTLTEIRDSLPTGGVPQAFRRAQASLRDRGTVNSTSISEAIIAASDAVGNKTLTEDVTKRVARKLRSANLDGLEFPPDRTVLQRPALRRVKTTEGVIVLYPDDLDRSFVERRPQADGGEIITIRTTMATEDDVVREGSRTTH